MIRGLLVLSLLFSASPARAETRFAGIPVATLAQLGLLEPTVLDHTDGWRAPIAGGGWVLHRWSPDESQARVDFSFLRSTVQSILPAVLVEGADEAWGDDGFVSARRGNVMVQVHAPGAPALAARLLAAESPESATAPSLSVPGGRDEFGRRAESTAK